MLGTSCSSFYIEWHLDQPYQTDLLVSIAGEQRHTLLKNMITTDYTSHDERWKYLFRFLRNWDLFIGARIIRVPHIWLAFDYDHPSESFTPPNLHFCIDKRFTERNARPDYRNILSRRQFDRILRTFSGDIYPAIAPSSLKMIRHCFTALEEGGEVLHLSFMQSRTPPVFKLNVTMPRNSLSRRLGAMNWNGNIKAVEKLCGQFVPKCKRIKANICIEETIRNRLELELEYNNPLEHNADRDRMLAELLSGGYISPQQHQALSSWAGRTRYTVHGYETPVSGERWLDVKLSLDENGNLTVKPYLGFASAPKIHW